MVSARLLAEVVTTILVYLMSKNRRHMKFALGFVKLSIHSPLIELVGRCLGQLVPALLAWPHNQKLIQRKGEIHLRADGSEGLIRRTFNGQVGDKEKVKKVLLNITELWAKWKKS